MPKLRDDGQEPEVMTSDMFGSAGGSFEAEAAKPKIEKAHADIATYLKAAEKSGAIKIPADKSTEVYQGLRDKIVGKDENWARMIEEVSEYGSASAGIMADIMKNAIGGIKNTAKKFIEEQIAAGNIEVVAGKKNVFFAELATASTKSLGGLGKA